MVNQQFWVRKQREKSKLSGLSTMIWHQNLILGNFLNAFDYFDPKQQSKLALEQIWAVWEWICGKKHCESVIRVHLCTTKQAYLKSGLNWRVKRQFWAYCSLKKVRTATENMLGWNLGIMTALNCEIWAWTGNVLIKNMPIICLIYIKNKYTVLNYMNVFFELREKSDMEYMSLIVGLKRQFLNFL